MTQTSPQEMAEVAKVARPSLRKAIDAYCKDCTYDPKAGGGTWRQQTEACTITRCPLYPVRPLSRSEG